MDNSPIGRLKEPIFEVPKDMVLITDNSSCQNGQSFLTKIVEDSEESLITDEDMTSKLSKLDITYNWSKIAKDDASMVYLGVRRNALKSFGNLNIETNIDRKKASICSTIEVKISPRAQDEKFEDIEIFSKTLKEKNLSQKSFLEG